MESIKIQPRISKQTKALLDQECTKTGSAPGSVVDAALHAYCLPKDEATKLDAVLQQLATIHAVLSGLIVLLEQRIDTPPVETPAATAAEWYTMEETAPEPQPVLEDAAQPMPPDTPHTGWLRRLFFTTERAQL